MNNSSSPFFTERMSRILLILCILVHTTIAQEVKLNSTLIQGRYAPPGQRVTFTCEVRGAEVMEWVSEDYIGAGGDLIEISRQDEGSNQTRLRGMTVATRIQVYRDNGITVIVSQLHITASDQFPMSSVTCRINSRQPNITVNFSVSDLIPTTTDSVVIGNVSKVTTVSEAPVSEGKDGTGLIAGIIVPLVIIILGIAFFLFILYIRWNQIVQQLRKCHGLMMVSSDESAKELEENRPEADNKNEQLNETVENQESNDGKVEGQGGSKSEAENEQLNRTVKNQGMDEVDQAHDNPIPDRRDPSGLKTLLKEESNDEKVKDQGGSRLEAVIEHLERTVKEHEQQSRKLMAERDELKNRLNDEKREGKRKDEQIHHLEAELERVKAELERVKAEQAKEVQSLLAKIEHLEKQLGVGQTTSDPQKVPKVENETVQYSGSKQKSDRDYGFIEPEDNVNGGCVHTLEQDLLHSQSIFEGPPGDLISFEGPAPMPRDPDVIKNPCGSEAVGGLVGVGGLVSGVVGVTGGIVGVLFGVAIAVIGVVYIIKKESNDDSERKKKEEEKKTTPDQSPTTGPAHPAVSRDPM